MELQKFALNLVKAGRHRQSGSIWLSLVAVGRVKAGFLSAIPGLSTGYPIVELSDLSYYHLLFVIIYDIIPQIIMIITTEISI